MIAADESARTGRSPGSSQLGASAVRSSDGRDEHWTQATSLNHLKAAMSVMNGVGYCVLRSSVKSNGVERMSEPESA
jgi:hypothetical protein